MTNRVLHFSLCFILTVLLVSPSFSQSKKVAHENQTWVGYMTSARLSEKYSLWNDAHLVPESFAIVRTGITRDITNNLAFTAGYAFLWLPATSGENEMKRHEHRPWGQMQFSVPIATSWSFSQRLRYDARFRDKVDHGEVIDGHVFNHRVRILLSVRKNFSIGKESKLMPYVTMSNETLLNFGKQVTSNTFDQNRLAFLVGVQHKQTQYQVGFMNRFVQTSPSNYTLNHTLVFWVIQKVDLRKFFTPTSHHEVISE